MQNRTNNIDKGYICMQNRARKSAKSWCRDEVDLLANTNYELNLD